jgi:hypothetical protein
MSERDHCSLHLCPLSLSEFLLMISTEPLGGFGSDSNQCTVKLARAHRRARWVTPCKNTMWCCRWPLKKGRRVRGHILTKRLLLLEQFAGEECSALHDIRPRLAVGVAEVELVVRVVGLQRGGGWGWGWGWVWVRGWGILQSAAALMPMKST